MITLTKPTNTEKSQSTNTHKPAEIVETAGSLAMLFQNGLMTMGQYDEFIASNPFSVDYSLYSNYESDDMAYDGGFLSDFSSAVSVLGTGFSTASFSCSDCGCGSCGGFSSVC